MAEFRWQGINVSGRPVQSILNARSMKEAKQRVGEIAASRHVRVTALQKRATFRYKVRKGTEKPVQGEQKAFSKEDVEGALRRMGYQVIHVQKKLFEFRMKPPFNDVVLFIRLSADLLREKLPYEEVLQMMMADIQSVTLKEAIREIQQELKEGKDGEEVFGKQEGVLGRFAAHMLGVASKSGNMVEIYETTAKFLERNQQFKKDLKSALVMPAVTMAAMLGAVAFYVAYIFPKTAGLFRDMGVPLPPMTAATLQLSDFLQANILYLLGGVALLGAGVFQFVRSPRGKLFTARWMIRLPALGQLLHKTSIEIFSRVFYALYSGSGENMEPIRIAAEACQNRYMEERIKTVALPMMLKDGSGLVEALEATGVFTDTAISRYRSGTETGTIRKAALQLAEYYERDTSYRMKSVVDFIQINVTMFMMIIMIALTVVSAETTTVDFNP